jgi:hypothetical protein
MHTTIKRTAALAIAAVPLALAAGCGGQADITAVSAAAYNRHVYISADYAIANVGNVRYSLSLQIEHQPDRYDGGRYWRDMPVGVGANSDDYAAFGSFRHLSTGGLCYGSHYNIFRSVAVIAGHTSRASVPVQAFCGT